MSQAANYALPVHSHFQEPDKTHTPEVKGTRCVLFWTTQVRGMWRYNPSQIRSCHLFNYQLLIKFCRVFKRSLQAVSPRKPSGRGLHILFAVCDVTLSKVSPSPHRNTRLNRPLLTKQRCSTLMGLQSFSHLFLTEEERQIKVPKNYFWN